MDATLYVLTVADRNLGSVARIDGEVVDVLDRHLPGSVAEKLVRASRVPVMTVRADGG